MTIIDIIWYRQNNFWNITFENTNGIGFSDLRVQIVSLFYSQREKVVFKKSCFVWSLEIFSEFCEKHVVFGERTNWKR